MSETALYQASGNLPVGADIRLPVKANMSPKQQIKQLLHKFNLWLDHIQQEVSGLTAFWRDAPLNKTDFFAVKPATRPQSATQALSSELSLNQTLVKLTGYLVHLNSLTEAERLHHFQHACANPLPKQGKVDTQQVAPLDKQHAQHLTASILERPQPDGTQNQPKPNKAKKRARK